MSSSRSWSVLLHLIASHAAIDLQVTPKFQTILHERCEASPDVARAIVGTMQERNKPVPPEQQVNASTAPLKRKWKLDQDPPYRPSKSTRLSRSSAYLNEIQSHR
ncbi:hypothetical protein BDV34DRAFT_184605 [Aspergillus parasiticus]|uniref:Uncharacterized protein n=1 Tax=Aspergillus parasiticus TaxID=5067 RepID=A0A5N6E3V8_ASPPA|nr:hypothetical protein BDV34DRAFT_184605 [Aspergillus parasiticus]